MNKSEDAPRFADQPIKREVHRLRRINQLPEQLRRNGMKLPNIIRPGELDLQPTPTSLVAKASDLHILNGLPPTPEWVNAMGAVRDPIPAVGAPLKMGVEIKRRHRSRLDADVVAVLIDRRTRQPSFDLTVRQDQ